MSRTKKISDYEVLDKAFNIIAREGFHSFTFAQVSKAVGLSPAALVKRFKTKNQLALLARNQRWEQNIGQSDSKKFKDLNGFAGIFDFLVLIANSVNSKRLGEHAIWLGTEACHHQSRRKVAGYFEVTRGVFEKLLKEAINNGELSGILDPSSFAKTLEALVQGAIFQFAFMEYRSIELHLKEHFLIVLKPYIKKV